MVDKIIDGISVKLNEVFGDDRRIYSEEVEQGFKEPCFFIACITASGDQVVSRRYKHNQTFDIHYFPKSGKDEIHLVADQLYSTLEYINCGESMIRGTKMHYESVDGVLHFFVDYNIQVIKESNQESMDGLTLNSTTKG